jgi:peptidoglycan/LPS O-acetylase OafA/YrhL
MGHLVGLDGVRGLAVVAVVVFHVWPHRLPAGFLGVSLFFTLSGYLITRLLLAERHEGRLSLRAFWGRRLRRLAPASLATIGVVTAVWWAVGWWDDRVRGDVLAGVAQVANWRQIATGDRYGVDPAASPLLHLWSLAIEEQVYVVLPLLVWWVGVRAAPWLFVGVTAVAVAGTVVHTGDVTVTYYATHVRVGEVALGALAAALVHMAGGRTLPRRAAAVGGAVVIASGVGLGVIMATTSLATPAYARGGLLAVAVLSTVVVAGVVAVPAVGRMVDMRPLRWLGARSYGIYLVHWPLLVGFARWGVAPWLLPWLTVAATLVVAEWSLRYLETPIRERRWRWPAVRLGVPVAAAIVVTAVWIPTPAQVLVDVEAAQRRIDELLPASTVPASTVPASTVPATEPVPAAPRRTRWGVLGDSKALSLALGLAPADDPRVDLGAVVTGLGCPLGRGGRVRDSVASAPYVPLPECDWSARLDEAVAARGDVDVMLVYFGSWDVRQRQVEALGSRWVAFPDDDYQAWLQAEAAVLHDAVLGHVASTVQWMTVPTDPAFPHPERFAAFNDFVRGQAEHPSGCVGVIDLAAWFAVDDRGSWALRDGIHTTWEPDGGTSRLVGEAYLIDVIVERVRTAEAAGCRGAPPDRPLPTPLPDRG